MAQLTKKRTVVLNGYICIVFYYIAHSLRSYSPENSHELRIINDRMVESDKEHLFATTMLPAIDRALSLGTQEACTAKTSRERDPTVGKGISFNFHHASGSTDCYHFKSHALVWFGIFGVGGNIDLDFMCDCVTSIEMGRRLTLN